MLDHQPKDGSSDAPRAGVRGAGAVLAVAGLVLYVWLVGAGEVIGELGRLAPPTAGWLVIGGFLPILLWGLSLRLVLAGVGVPIPVRGAVALFLAAVFLNGVTPLGQAGGDPPSGLLIARVVDTEFERGLAAIGSVNALNRVGVVFLGGVGAAWLAARSATPAWVTVAIAASVALSIGVLAVAAVAWHGRDSVVRVVGDAVAASLVRVGASVPLVTPPSRESVVGRVRGFVAALERLVAQPKRLIAASLLGVAGQVAVAGVLWQALSALDAQVPVPLVLVVVPMAKLGGLAPTPGGTASAEVLLSGLLVTVAGVPLPVATASALLYRATAFWTPSIVGGLVTVWLLARGDDDGRETDDGGETNDGTTRTGHSARR